MTYVKRRPFHRKPKDILALSLKNLRPGEELLCTKRTYEVVESRVDAFRAIQKDWTIAAIPAGELRKIRRKA